MTKRIVDPSDIDSQFLDLRRVIRQLELVLDFVSEHSDEPAQADILDAGIVLAQRSLESFSDEFYQYIHDCPEYFEPPIPSSPQGRNLADISCDRQNQRGPIGQ